MCTCWLRLEGSSRKIIHLNCITILCLLLDPIKDVIKRTMYQILVYCIGNNKLYRDLTPITWYDKLDYKKCFNLYFIVSQNNKLYPDLMPITRYDKFCQIKNWYFRGRQCQTDRNTARKNSMRVDYDYIAGNKVLLRQNTFLRKAESPYRKSHGLSRQFIWMEQSGFNAEQNWNDLITGE